MGAIVEDHARVLVSSPKKSYQKKFVFCCWMLFSPKIKKVLKTYNVYTHCSSKITMI
jgi:hypothetical protein